MPRIQSDVFQISLTASARIPSWIARRRNLSPFGPWSGSHCTHTPSVLAGFAFCQASLDSYTPASLTCSQLECQTCDKSCSNAERLMVIASTLVWFWSLVAQPHLSIIQRKLVLIQVMRVGFQSGPPN